MTDLMLKEGNSLAKKHSFFELGPADQVRQATELANVLSDVVKKQALFSLIQGKKYIKAEGWQTLGCFLGITPKERSVSRLADGSYEAYVDLVKFSDGTVVGGASSFCSRSENRWAKSDEYAIRSMAITRATGKAYRTSFAWIVTLAGYQPTPAEEMPFDAKGFDKEDELQTVIVADETQQPKPEAPKPHVPGTSKAAVMASARNGYEPSNPKHQDFLVKTLAKRNVPQHLWDIIGSKLKGKSFAELGKVIEESGIAF